MVPNIMSSCNPLLGLSHPEGEKPAGQDERRVWVRYPCDLEAYYQPAHDPDSMRWLARARNISRGGVNLIVDRHLEPGVVLSVELPGPAETFPTTVLAYVVRTEPLGDDEWSLGCTFAMELGEEDLHPLGATPTKAAAHDQRVWERTPCRAHVSFQVVRGGDRSELPAKVIDISPGGIGLLVGHSVDVGRLLSLTLQDQEQQYGLTILASVVRVTGQPDGAWIWGCTFIREITAQELTALLSDEPQAGA
jgi:hypothetical protein